MKTPDVTPAQLIALVDGLIVCGQRGRGAIRSALLGSVSHALAAHT